MPATGMHRTIGTPKGYTNEPEGRYHSWDKLYVGKVKDNRDVRFMGRLKVWIPELCPKEEEESGWIVVSYCSPFAGATNVRDNSNANTYEGTQKPYGFWAVPPDLNVQVLVMFVGGLPSKGYWIGCIFDEQMNFSIPGIASDDNKVPKTEYNRKVAGTGTQENPPRPEHTIMSEALTTQGLNTDTLRGINSSSARRRGDHGTSKEQSNYTSHYHQPSKVYGLLTPGGHQAVLDDGYDNGDGEPENSYVRFRTRNGTQVLIDDSQGFIYLISRDGKVWLELTDNQNGHLDVYSTTSISIHAENGDINMKAGRNINMQAGEDINIRSGENTNVLVENQLHVHTLAESFVHSEGDMNLKTDVIMRQESGDDFNVLAAGIYYEKGTQIHMNGPTPESAIEPEDPIDYSPPGPAINAGEWEPGDPYENDSNIIPRVPQHEPWEIHHYDVPVATKATVSPVKNSGTTAKEINSARPAYITNETVSIDPDLIPPVTGPGNTPLGGTICNLTEEQTQAYLDALGQKESSSNYSSQNTLGYTGKYQMGAGALVDTGYLDRNKYNAAIASGNFDNKTFINDSSNWTGKNGMNSVDDFKNSPQVQENQVKAYTNGNCRKLRELGVIDANADAATVAGYLAAAHLGGPGGAQALQGKAPTNGNPIGNAAVDDYGANTRQYFNLGVGSIKGLDI